MIVTTRSDELMTDEDTTFGAWADPSMRYWVTAVMYVEADPNFPSCLIRDLRRRQWLDAGQRHERVTLGWDAYEEVVDRWDSVVAVADCVTAKTSLRDEITGHIDQPSDTDALTERVLGFVT